MEANERATAGTGSQSEYMLAQAAEQAARRSADRARAAKLRAIVMTVVAVLIVASLIDQIPKLFGLFGVAWVGTLLGLLSVCVPFVVWRKVRRRHSVRPEERGNV